MRRGGPRNDFRNQPYSRNGGQSRRDYNDRPGNDIQFGRYDNNDNDRRRQQGGGQSYNSRGYGNSKGGYPSFGQRDDGGSSRGGGQRYGGRGGNYSGGGYDNRYKGGYGDE